MYTRYFGLEEKPFAISPDPRYLYMSESHREALAHLLYGINSDGCLVLLTGDVGIGKTTVCRCLLEQLPENTDVALVFNPRLDAEELVKTICEELLILPEQEQATGKDYIDSLNRHLLAAHAGSRTTVLIIDEAQNLKPDVLEQLRLLTNLETNTHKLLRIILIGQPELRLMLEQDELSQVNQRITSRYHLTALEPVDVRNYILHRLAVAGNETTKLFSEKAIQFITRQTKGIPRLINLLCDRALLGAYAENTDHVDLTIAKRAAKEVFNDPCKSVRPPRNNRGLKLAALSICTLFIAGILYYAGLPLLQGNRDSEPAAIEQTAKPEQIQKNSSIPENVPPKQPEPRQSRIRITDPIRLATLADYLFGDERTTVDGRNGD